MTQDASKIKREIRQRDGWRCTECGLSDEEHHELYGKTLEVHRIIPGSSYDLEGCTTLCRACHGSKPKRENGVAMEETGRAMVPIPQDLYLELKALARENNRPVSWEIREILEQALRATRRERNQ